MNRSTWRTLRPSRRPSSLHRDQVIDILLVCIASGIVGLSFGAIAVSAGLPLWLPALLSVVVFAGAAQFIFVGVILAGGNPLAGALAAVLVNLRLLPLGFAIADSPGRGWRSAIGAHLITDETVAFTLQGRGPSERRSIFWASGFGLFVFWNAGVLLGGWLGDTLASPETLGLDAAFPAVLVALTVPLLGAVPRKAKATAPPVAEDTVTEDTVAEDAKKDPAPSASPSFASARIAALVGGITAVVVTPWVPAGLAVLCAAATAVPVHVIAERVARNATRSSGSTNGSDGSSSTKTHRRGRAR